jgi:hypothetical protein
MLTLSACMNIRLPSDSLTEIYAKLSYYSAFIYLALVCLQMVWIINHFRQKRVKYHLVDVEFTMPDGQTYDKQGGDKPPTEDEIKEAQKKPKSSIYEPVGDVFWKGKYWAPTLSAYFSGTDLKSRHVIIYNLCFYFR